jgi:hypothetical protein
LSTRWPTVWPPWPPPDVVVLSARAARREPRVTHPRRRLVRVAVWPAADAAAWKVVCNPTPGPFSDNPPRSAATYDIYARGYGFYLAYLRSEGLLDPAETPAQRVFDIRTDGGALPRLTCFRNVLADKRNSAATSLSGSNSIDFPWVRTTEAQRFRCQAGSGM